VLLTINSLFAALTCIPIYLIALRMFGEKVARWSTWTWALLPYTWYWSIHWVWDTTLSPLLLSVIVLVALELEQWESFRGWVLFGALWGAAALTNPSLLSFLPFCGLWLWYRRHQRGLPSVIGVATASLVFFLCIAPWQMRNQRTFHQFVLLRDNFGHELRLGNSPYAAGISTVQDQPNLSVAELGRFRSMGELRFSQQRGREAVDYIREHPLPTLAVDLRKMIYFWAGIPKRDYGWLVGFLRNSLFLLSSVLALWGLVRALRKLVSGAGLLGLLILVYPLTYYIVYPHARYRHPIEPEMIILAVFLVADLAHSASQSMNSVH
jgi:4-amino-4-deoxy-L-arabinose transferase-like glycosyltransferase